MKFHIHKGLKWRNPGICMKNRMHEVKSRRDMISWRLF